MSAHRFTVLRAPAHNARRSAAARRPRRLIAESLESRRLLAADAAWSPALLALDTTCDGSVAADDVVAIVNRINRFEAGDTPAGGVRSAALDVNRDGFVSAADVLPVINQLNWRGTFRVQVPEAWEGRTPVISDAQQENLQQLFADLNALRADCAVTPEQVSQLVDDFRALLDGATRPDEDAITQLVEDYQAAVDDDEVTPAEGLQLTRDVQAVLSSASIPLEEVQSVVADLQAIVTASGVTAEDVQQIADDVQAIVAEFQNQHDVRQEQREEIRQLLADVLAGLSSGDSTHADAARSAVMSTIVGERQGDAARSAVMSTIVGERQGDAARKAVMSTIVGDRQASPDEEWVDVTEDLANTAADSLAAAIQAGGLSI